jgi:hypothetical protein
MGFWIVCAVVFVVAAVAEWLYYNLTKGTATQKVFFFSLLPFPLPFLNSGPSFSFPLPFLNSGRHSF